MSEWRKAKYLVAVSGGIDSVVLLDMLARSGKGEIIVAHFDHGIRKDSAADARFVQGLAAKYNLPFVSKREELGKDASEDLARKRRYYFLRREAKTHGAVVVTAHHQDDIIESIVINIVRGTGWRGLAVFGASDISRPLLHFSKADIREYALRHRLEWVEDSTNASTLYLRNRLRQQIKTSLPEKAREAVLRKWQAQQGLKTGIDKEVEALLDTGQPFSRYFLTMIDQGVAIELLRAAVSAKTDRTLTRPQIERMLLAVKTARPGTNYEAGSGVTLHFTTHTFIA